MVQGTFLLNAIQDQVRTFHLCHVLELSSIWMGHWTKSNGMEEDHLNAIRTEKAHVAVYEQNVGDMHVPYIVPGECSSRADVRWVTFQNKDGVGIYASIYGSSPPMQINASYCTTAELDRATHNHDLVKGDDIEVHLDHQYMGLAGDDSWTPCVHEEYLIPAVPYSFSFRLCPVTPATSGLDIYKTQLQS